ncbi:hypothetical protein AQPE_2705 [Aquipluma nitroreducens]|uniref:Uncharacterized protein n=1 Tax=Aquipluma nitroreducens TaxID=2010828 RepID=A0A5K7SAD1_9BACT|nr:hypothetical protein [Aquipluma nitroreducens]BBE18543.1 hypothetical protein AQPE_2705 [Aquipluma nitroreducens]
MKTKITSLIIICTLGLVGVLNANAALSNKNSSIGAEVINVKLENLNSSEFVFNDNADATIDYRKEAQLVTKWVADLEEAKAVQKLIDEGVFGSNQKMTTCAGEAKSENPNASEFIFNEDADAAIDYRKEAQLVTKWIADREEAKVVQKLIDEGKLAENK